MNGEPEQTVARVRTGEREPIEGLKRIRPGRQTRTGGKHPIGESVNDEQEPIAASLTESALLGVGSRFGDVGPV